MSIDTFPIEFIASYRRKIFRTASENRLTSLEAAIDFINKRGILAFWPLKDIPMPSLWAATAGDRPVPDEHDDPGHMTWGWKDELLGQRKCFYGRILCRRNFFVSLDNLPYLYALSNNFGDPAEDHLILYESGELPQTAFRIYDLLLKEGALDTLAIKRNAHLSGKLGDQQFNQAIDLLQMDFKIMPVGIANVGSWKYAFIYDLVPRQFPDLIDKAGTIQDHSARSILISNYLSSVGFATPGDIRKLFRWNSGMIDSVLKELINGHQVMEIELSENNVNHAGYLLSSLLEK